MDINKARIVNKTFVYCITHHLFNDDDLIAMARVMASAMERVLSDNEG